MTPAQIIRRKRDGEELSAGELADFFQAFARGALPDYQMAAFLMAVYYRGLSGSELATLVETMIASGKRLDHGSGGPRIDKHSTGGVGDKVSLVLAPLVASLGVRLPMMTGRGLGHSGGTVDKLESIPGFSVDLDIAQMERQLDRLGCVLITQSSQVAPLDRRLYALRDVTGTVESIPLIASSIMSKKLAEGIDGLVLDVKRGNGAFLPELDDALELARTMIGIGEAHGTKTVALITAMDRPLGYAVGNALEVEEAIEALHGRGPADLREVTISLAAEMLVMAGGRDAAQARADAERALDDGTALERFRQIIEAQGGTPAVIDDPALLPQALVRRVLEASRAGVVADMDVRAIGEAAVELGAGRVALDSPIDPAVGFVITAKPGDPVERGQPLATVFAANAGDADVTVDCLRRVIHVADRASPPLPLISHRVTAEGTQEIAA